MGKKDMKFELEETLDASKVFWTDKAKLTLIYNNLLSNAYKYTPEHGTVTWKTTTEIE
jgi:signal transduction histidine kinase